MMILVADHTPYVSGEIALFEKLVRIGEERAHTELSVRLRMFLVGCLDDHLHDPDIVHRILALDFLESVRKSGEELVLHLKRTGDAGLILSGLFPERALRLSVSPRYFRLMGQASYGSLAAHLEVGAAFERGRLYNEVAREFVSLERVLNGARGSSGDAWIAFRRFRAQLG